MIKKIIFSGCSYTAGNGWNPITGSNHKAETASPLLWVNLCHREIKNFSQLELHNVGVGGASNTTIFERTMRAMLQHNTTIDTVVCQWTSMPRYNWHSKFDLKDDHTKNWDPTHSDNSENKYVRELIDRLRVMHHLHWEILKVVEYTNMILKLSQLIGVRNMFFVNGLCPWDDQYFLHRSDPGPRDYSEFTKQNILEVSDHHVDEYWVKLYNHAHTHYKQAGGINERYWINLYNSWQNNVIDHNFDGIHPGESSNRLYCELFKRRMQQLDLLIT